MAEKRRGRKKKELDDQAEDTKSQKLEYDVAKYLRSKLPSKRTTFVGHKVDYFIASKAIDCLLDSKWAVKGKNGEEPLFTTRESVVVFMHKMLIHQLFHRAKPIRVSKKDKKRIDDESSAAEDVREKKKDKTKKEKTRSERDIEREKSKDPNETPPDLTEEKEKDEKAKKKDNVTDKEKKKEKKKVKLDMHLEQIFVDGNEPYVWLYDPIPARTWFFGALIVVAAVAICLFPLWPKTFRSYVFYLSVAVATFLFTILVLVVLRLVIFVIVWLLTLGKHSFWILPNLTEDVGFIESFWPLYQYEYKGNKEEDKNLKEIKEDDNDDDKEEEQTKNDMHLTESELEKNPEVSGDHDICVDESIKASRKRSTQSERSSSSEGPSTRSSDNGFEILDTADS